MRRWSTPYAPQPKDPLCQRIPQLDTLIVGTARIDGRTSDVNIVDVNIPSCYYPSLQFWHIGKLYYTRKLVPGVVDISRVPKNLCIFHLVDFLWFIYQSSVVNENTLDAVCNKYICQKSAYRKSNPLISPSISRGALVGKRGFPRSHSFLGNSKLKVRCNPGANFPHNHHAEFRFSLYSELIYLS